MTIDVIQYFELTSLSVPHDRSEVSFTAVSEDRETSIKCWFWNRSESKVKFEVNNFAISMIYDPDHEYPTLGEIELVLEKGDTFTFEGDFGWFGITSECYRIEKLT